VAAISSRICGSLAKRASRWDTLSCLPSTPGRTKRPPAQLNRRHGAAVPRLPTQDVEPGLWPELVRKGFFQRQQGPAATSMVIAVAAAQLSRR
jgi:hypothetical protein